MRKLYKELIGRKAKVAKGKGNSLYEPGDIFEIDRIEEDELNKGALWAFERNDIIYGVRLADLEIIDLNHIKCKERLALCKLPYLELDIESKVLGIDHDTCACGSFSTNLDINFCPICGEKL